MNDDHQEWIKEVINITKPGEKDLKDIKSVLDLFDYCYGIYCYGIENEKI